jgi:hypothetical protein
MRVTDQKVNLEQFIRAGELLDVAFPDPLPAPDYLAHHCELAERAVDSLIAAHGSTRDVALSRLFALRHVPGAV